jgi:hypothetical protein
VFILCGCVAATTLTTIPPRPGSQLREHGYLVVVGLWGRNERRNAMKYSAFIAIAFLCLTPKMSQAQPCNVLSQNCQAFAAAENVQRQGTGSNQERLVPRVGPTNLAALPAPSSLSAISDPKACGTNQVGSGTLGQLGCEAWLLQGGHIILVWKWNSAARPQSFQVYTINNANPHNIGQPGFTDSFVATVDSGQSGYALNPPPQGYGGKCYAVTAVRGSLESTTSNAVCLSQGYLAPPALLRIAKDPAECAQHGGAEPALSQVSCTSLFQNGGLVLVWNWDSAVAVSGFNIDQGNNGKYSHYDSVRSGSKTTGYLAGTTAKWRGKCFVVSALSGSGQQSVNSNPVCLPPS